MFCQIIRETRDLDTNFPPSYFSLLQELKLFPTHIMFFYYKRTEKGDIFQ